MTSIPPGWQRISTRPPAPAPTSPTCYLGGNFLYLQNESDNRVVDFLASQSVASGWSLRPLAKLDGGWVLLRSERPQNSGVLCVGSYQFPCGGRGAQSMDSGGAYLARGANGDYDGPW